MAGTAVALSESLRSEIARLREEARTIGAVETWTPQPGDTLAGVLIGGKKMIGRYGTGDGIVIQDENGKLIAAWLTSFLRQQLESAGAEVGDLIAITFQGKGTSALGQPFNKLDVLVRKASISQSSTWEF